MSSRFNDLTLTNYPNELDTKVNNANMADNIDYDGTDLSSDNYVMAADSNALRDAIIALQRFVGVENDVVTGETDQTVADLLSAAAGGQLSMDTLDTRYGGVEWVFSGAPKILTHVHGAGVGQAPQISLATGVTGKLLATNILLDGTATSLKASDIPLATGNSTKISEALNDKLSLTNGGTVSGAVTFANRVATNCMAELECENMTNVTASNDSTTWSGKAGVVEAASSGSAVTSVIQTRLRYGTYGVILRAKAASNASTSTILTVNVSAIDSAGSTSLYKTVTLTGTSFTAANTYQEFYIPFTHTSTARKTEGLPNISISLVSAASRPAMSFDSIVITPINAGGWGEA